MNAKIVAVIIVVIVVAASAAGAFWYSSNSNPNQTYSPSPTPTSHATATPSPGVTNSPGSSGTPSLTPSGSTSSPTISPSPTPASTLSTPTTTNTPVSGPTPTPVTTSTPFITPTPVATPTPTPTPLITPTPPPIPPTTATFNFDAGTPTLSTGRPTPFDQTFSGITATFSSLIDPAGFSVQSQSTLFFTLRQMSGNFLYQNGISKNSLYVKFNVNVKSISLTFATVDYHDPGVNGTASNIRLTAYVNTVSGTNVGTVITHGTFTTDTYPQGTLTFSAPAGQTFNFVVIDLPPLAQGASVFLVDNIVVNTA